MKRSVVIIVCFVSLIMLMVCPSVQADRKSKADQEREAKWQETKRKAEANRQAAEKSTTKEKTKEESSQPMLPVDDVTGANSESKNAELIIDLKNLAEWMKENNPTPAQSKAYNRYKVARETYNAFLTKSAEMVKAMDKSTGSSREDLLNKLRLRKNDEQPIASEMKKAQEELLAAFPEIKREPAKK